MMAVSTKALVIALRPNIETVLAGDRVHLVHGEVLTQRCMMTVFRNAAS